jgi:deazaflavin-dependent oxidoreductase (nitroreductase family)
MSDEKKTAIRIPPKGTKGSRMMEGGGVMGRIAHGYMSRQVNRFQKATGPEPMKFMGFPALVLTTVGAKSGVERKQILGGFPDGDNAWLIVASKGGAASHPHWFINIAKNPDKVWVQVGNRKMRVHVDSLQGKEREDAYARVVAVAKNYGSYPKKTDREIPVLRVTPAE